MGPMGTAKGLGFRVTAPYRLLKGLRKSELSGSGAGLRVRLL